ncbi:MAG: hypothetical protein M3Y07_08570, partial [Acidobacteriota bacterium]|nr:hypothetical protein [Acidobacteriota bacterium]
MPRVSIREQLQRILACSEFAQAERMCRFLRLVVDYTLENRASELKEYLIGVEVFDRKDSYDPRLRGGFPQSSGEFARRGGGRPGQRYCRTAVCKSRRGRS